MLIHVGLRLDVRVRITRLLVPIIPLRPVGNTAGVFLCRGMKLIRFD
jgi:hypothetical protein